MSNVCSCLRTTECANLIKHEKGKKNKRNEVKATNKEVISEIQ